MKAGQRLREDWFPTIFHRGTETVLSDRVDA